LNVDAENTTGDTANRNTSFMTWNLMHLVRMRKDGGGIPVHGNPRSAWDAGCRFDFEKPRLPMTSLFQDTKVPAG
jgi:hypothetical protein